MNFSIGKFYLNTKTNELIHVIDEIKNTCFKQSIICRRMNLGEDKWVPINLSDWIESDYEMWKKLVLSSENNRQYEQLWKDNITLKKLDYRLVV
jgi:hypothetical protein